MSIISVSNILSYGRPLVYSNRAVSTITRLSVFFRAILYLSSVHHLAHNDSHYFSGLFGFSSHSQMLNTMQLFDIIDLARFLLINSALFSDRPDPI